jgi:hypothetical protein
MFDVHASVLPCQIALSPFQRACTRSARVTFAPSGRRIGLADAVRVSKTPCTGDEQALYAAKGALSAAQRSMIRAKRSMSSRLTKNFRTFQRNRQDFLPPLREDSRALASHGGGPDSKRAVGEVRQS